MGIILVPVVKVAVRKKALEKVPIIVKRKGMFIVPKLE